MKPGRTGWQGSLAIDFTVMRLLKKTFLGLCLGMLLAAGFARGQVSPPTEYQLKAAFLYNFAKFVDWPPEAFADEQSPFIIGVLGESPFGGDLDQTVAGKKINDRTILIQTFRSVTEVTNCHILFICNSEEKRLPETIKKLTGRAILTVGETDRFIGAGGMVNFTQEANKIRFQINNDTARASRLKISSKLLNLAVNSSR